MDKKDFIIDKICYLNEDQYLEIFKILHENNTQYTINNNGVFIDLNLLKKRILNKIFNYVKYCINNNQILTNRLDKLKEEEENLKHVEEEVKEIKQKKKVEYNMKGNKIDLKKEKLNFSNKKNKIIKNY